MEVKKLYYRIGEVAEMFNIPTSTIRYWESEFDVLRPRKSTKGNRLFTERDLRYLQVIYQLVKVKGHTIQGAKDAMRTKFDKLEENAGIAEQHFGYYRALANRFHQSIYYKIEGDRVIVWRVLDQRFDPRRIEAALSGSDD